MKKRSAASSSSKPPEPLLFFIDRSLGRRVIAEIMTAHGVDVRVHDDHFPPDTPDIEWLREVGLRGWIVLTKDSRIRYRRAELEALRRAGVGAFVLTSGDLRADEMAQVFLTAMPAIRRFAAKNPRPYIASLSRAGSIRQIY